MPKSRSRSSNQRRLMSRKLISLKTKAETEEEVKRRLERCRSRMREFRAAETEEQTRKRREYSRRKMKETRANETEEQRRERSRLQAQIRRKRTFTAECEHRTDEFRRRGGDKTRLMSKGSVVKCTKSRPSALTDAQLKQIITGVQHWVVVKQEEPNEQQNQNPGLDQEDPNPGLDQEDPEPTHIKEEPWTDQEGEGLHGLIRMIPVLECSADVVKLSVVKEEIPTEQEDLDPGLIKEEGWTSGGREEAEFTTVTPTPASAKSEHDDKPQSSQLLQTKPEENREDCGGPAPDMNPVHMRDSGRPSSKSKSRRTFDELKSSVEANTNSTEHRTGGSSVRATSPQKKNSTRHRTKSADKCRNDRNNDTEGQTKPHECSECGHAFGKRSDLKRHVRIHSGEKPFVCSDCGAAFTQKSNLDNHTRGHTGQKPFYCSDCGSGFTLKSSLNIHMRVHTGDKPFMCSVCKRRFRHNSSFRTHMATHTGEKTFSCAECGAAFTRKSNLNRHMRVHTGEKPYRCVVCQKHFSVKSNFKTHMATHTGEKQFGCSVCGKIFAQKSHLDSHSRVHTGEKPFHCSVCHKGFSQKSHVQKHMKIHKRP